MNGTALARIACCLLVPASAAGSPAPDAEAVRRIDAVITSAAEAGADGVLRIRRGNEVLLERAWGTATCDGEEPLTAEHLFDIGSITKVVTAAAVLKAVESERLGLDTTVGAVIPEAPGDKRSITVLSLLTHRSGLPESLGADETLVNRTFFLRRLFETPGEPLPEGETLYSNAGYSLLAAMLERRTGMAYETWAQRELFAPAGVGIGYTRPADRGRLACGTLDGLPWGSTADYFGPHGPSWYLLGNGGLLASVRELDRWFDALWSGKLLGPESTEMIRDALTRRDRSGRRILLVGGSNRIFSSQYERWPDDGLVFILFTSDAEWPKEKLVPDIRRVIERLAAEERR